MLTMMLLVAVGLVNCNKIKDSDLLEVTTLIVKNNPNASNVSVSIFEQVATLSGTVESDEAKSQIQSSIMGVEGVNSVVNNIRVVPPTPKIEAPIEVVISDQVRVATRKGKLNVHNKPGVQELVIAVVAHGDMLTILDKVSDEWWLVETKNGVSGYTYASYLEQQ